MTPVPSQATAADDWDQQIGARLRDLRMSLGLRQADFAERLGKDRSTISKYERGERQLALTDLLEITARLDYPLLPLVLKLLPASAVPPGLDTVVAHLVQEPGLVEAIRMGLQQ